MHNFLGSNFSVNRCRHAAHRLFGQYVPSNAFQLYFGVNSPLLSLLWLQNDWPVRNSRRVNSARDVRGQPRLSALPTCPIMIQRVCLGAYIPADLALCACHSSDTDA